MSGFLTRARMDDRVVLITGGAGHVGRAVATVCADLGAAVVVADLPGAGGAAVAAGLGGRHHALDVNLEDEASVRALVPETLQRCGRLDVIVHAAALVGTSASEGWVTPFETQSFGLWRRALEVNLTAPLALTQAAVPALRIYGDTGMGSPTGYAASKGGLVQMTRWLATVLAPHVRVNAVSLGGIARGQAPAFVEAYEARTPLRRMGTGDGCGRRGRVPGVGGGLVDHGPEPHGGWRLDGMVTRWADGCALGGRRIGGGAPCFVIAEAGVNHNSDLYLARQLVDVAAAAGERV
jgi:NAD(P)-dependent dehydrogenase (short-subunit alcohol dehydrogenase family)